MKEEYKEKLELSKKLLHDSLKNRSPEGESMFWKGHNLMEELIETKNTDVLCGLFDLFTEENENGVCETLYNGILENFTVDQIIEALHKKFSELVVNNEMRAIYFAGYCLNTENFNNFRSIFNSTRVNCSEKFLDEFEDTYKEDYPEEIAILRKDMETWPKK